MAVAASFGDPVDGRAGGTSAGARGDGRARQGGDARRRARGASRAAGARRPWHSLSRCSISRRRSGSTPLRRAGRASTTLRFHCRRADRRGPAAGGLRPRRGRRTCPPLDPSRPARPSIPDRSTTLLVQVERSGTAGGPPRAAPASRRTRRLARGRRCPPISGGSAQPRAASRCGVDLVLVAGIRLAALPRSHHRGGRLMYVAVKGGERAIDNAHALARRGAARRPGGGRALRSPRSRAAGARRRSRDERGLLLRPRARGARHQAGARRSDRGDLPAARLPDDAAALRLFRARRHGRHAGRRRISATFKDLPGGRFSGRPSTTPTGCSTSSCWPTAERAPARRPRPAPMPTAAARAPTPRPRGPDRARGRGRSDASRGRSHPRAPVVSGRPRGGSRTWPVATKAFCLPWATRPSAASADASLRRRDARSAR